MYIYFTAMKNSQGVPLTYVILKTPTPSVIFIYGEQDIIKNDPLKGNMFSRNTKKVLEILKELTEDTDDETWMNSKYCG